MFKEDLSPFLNDFGQRCEAFRDSVKIASFTGIYDDPALEGTVGTVLADVRSNQVLCRADDVEPLQRDDMIRINGADYFLLEVVRDGTGMATLFINPFPVD